MESARKRSELGEQGYEAFIWDWTREAHLVRYFDYIDRIGESQVRRRVGGKEIGAS
jgi:hypothetical protein